MYFRGTTENRTHEPAPSDSPRVVLPFFAIFLVFAPLLDFFSALDHDAMALGRFFAVGRAVSSGASSSTLMGSGKNTPRARYRLGRSRGRLC